MSLINDVLKQLDQRRQDGAAQPVALADDAVGIVVSQPMSQVDAAPFTPATKASVEAVSASMLNYDMDLETSPVLRRTVALPHGWAANHAVPLVAVGVLALVMAGAGWWWAGARKKQAMPVVVARALPLVATVVPVQQVAIVPPVSLPVVSAPAPVVSKTVQAAIKPDKAALATKTADHVDAPAVKMGMVAISAADAAVKMTPTSAVVKSKALVAPLTLSANSPPLASKPLVPNAEVGAAPAYVVSVSAEDEMARLQQVLQNNPRDAQAQSRLLTMLADKGLHEQRRELLRNLATIDPARFALQAARAHIAAKDHGRSLTLLDMVPADVRDAGYYTTKGALLSAQGRPKDAIDSFQVALRSGVADADQAVVRLSLAASFEQMASVPSAIEQYEKVLQLGTNASVQQHAQKALQRLSRSTTKLGLAASFLPAVAAPLVGADPEVDTLLPP